MDLEIKEHVAIVQGASKGIGRGIAEALAAEGVDLILTARGEEKLKETAETIARYSGRRVVVKTADTANLDSAKSLVETAKREFGRLDILVCNSGGPPPGNALDLGDAQWREANDLLVLSPLALLQAAMPLLKHSSSPRFFVVTSSSIRKPIGGLTLSNVYRPAVHGLIKTLAEELATDGVRCHSLAPGRIDTDRLQNVFEMQAEKTGKTPEEIRAAVIGAVPASRLGNPVDVGHLCAFLSSPLADYLTGQNWLIDGGLVNTI